jgi:hypothetical protein
MANSPNEAIKWILVYPPFFEASVNDFLQEFRKVSIASGLKLNPPVSKKLPGDRPEDYQKVSH